MEALLGQGVLPEPLIRFGIQQLLRKRLWDESGRDVSKSQDSLNKMIETLRTSPIAVETKAANEQHYELPPDFFKLVMGPWLKYSSGFWDDGCKSLGEAEEAMLELYVERAGIEDGMDILDLGCGWGSLSLYLSKRFPNAKITGVSNSAAQKAFIEARAAELGVKKPKIVTKDMNSLALRAKFDRVLSIEMFEHMRNYQKLLKNISGWLKDDGMLFVHIFTHKEHSYLFESKDATDWLSRNFFTGGIMPSDHLLFYFNDDLRVQKHWVVNGQHYQKTSEAWLTNMKANQAEVMEIFREHYGKDADKWWNFWKIFFMSCAELWGFRGGNEWHVSHYLLGKV